MSASDDNRRRGSFQMKEGMNKSRAGMDLFDFALAEQGDGTKRNVADEKMRINFTLFFERVIAVHAAAKQNLKGAGKCMLVDCGCAIQPVIDIDIESLTDENRDGWISKF